ncbi:MAG: GDP-mannose 4,6-dehydratase [Candidatus Lokiarchaeota archaeon]|nr:GDP-mannose 4,6-dehydratase [Candidatus Lokiarchaeota archaeon]MBD3212952.1 GDP-mannose 4,6-dehydratase [Candidatus Lokiarchaeota archaeon]
MKKALITGITGQDGSYLAEYLLRKNYEVHGIIRRASTFNTQRLDKIYQDPHEINLRLKLHYGDLVDASSISRLIEKVQPDEIYNLGAQSHVKVSFEQPEYTSNVNAMGTLRLLDTIRDSRIDTKYYQASSSEIYGKVHEIPQNENTPFYPRSPYAISKLYAYWITINYREAYGLFACNGILFNHESPRRGKRFVTRKISRAVAKIKDGLQEKLYLGNLDAQRDWGYAPEYVEAMWMMLNHDKPLDLVIATGETHTVREFAELAFRRGGFDIYWDGKGVNEKGIDQNTGETLIVIDERYFRPTEVDILLGDSSLARKEIGWDHSVGFNELVNIMVDSDIKMLQEKGEIGLDYLE